MNNTDLFNENLCKEILLTANKVMADLGAFYVYYPSSNTMLKFPEPKYKFSRAKWYVADFDPQYYFQVEEWCKEQFGPHPKRPDAWSRWHHTYEDQIHFRDAKDYEWFVLRWS